LKIINFFFYAGVVVVKSEVAELAPEAGSLKIELRGSPKFERCLTYDRSFCC
jgi:hypothetical protein